MHELSSAGRLAHPLRCWRPAAWLLAVCAALSANVPAQAQTPAAVAPASGKIDLRTMTGPDGQPLSKGEIKAIRDFQMLDFNKDGKISRKELALVPRLYAGFDAADTNKDNYLSLEEVRAFAIQYRAERDAAKAQAAPPAAGAPHSSGK